MSDGNWKQEIPLPPASPINQGRIVLIDHSAAYNSDLLLNGQKVKVSRGFNKTYISTGERWIESQTTGKGNERKPKHFGVPVVTLIGYYDPDGELTSYIYPALYGACGFGYPDDRDTLNDDACYLRVETKDGELRFRLAKSRLTDGGKVMNKFHINVPTSSRPTQVSIVSKGRVLDQESISPSDVPLLMTVNGIPIQNSRRTE